METLPRVALPPKVRAVFYLTLTVLIIAQQTTEIGFQAADAPIPIWLAVVGRVLLFLAAAFGVTAASNTPVREVPPLVPVDRA